MFVGCDLLISIHFVSFCFQVSNVCYHYFD